MQFYTNHWSDLFILVKLYSHNFHYFPNYILVRNASNFDRCTSVAPRFVPDTVMYFTQLITYVWFYSFESQLDEHDTGH